MSDSGVPSPGTCFGTLGRCGRRAFTCTFCGAASAEAIVLRESWDAGELGCSRLVFELRRRVNELSPGDELEVIAHDPGAPIDLAAWCRMTGHELVEEEHPVYVIRRRAD
jgi:tRNA 2-thiouridine synthesizing protein A